MILITGGAGYIGSHVNKILCKAGYKTVVLDNLVCGHKEAVLWGDFVYGDIEQQDILEYIFDLYPIDTVLHFAAYAYVGESVLDPAKYYGNNVAGTICLLNAMRKYGVKKIVFSSTCATYGVPTKFPITEDTPQKPISPYGRSKLMVERIIADYGKAYGIKYCCLRYFNAAGADPDGEIGESHTPETHLIPLVLDAASGVNDSINVFGLDYDTYDGSCIRDYIHVVDLADAHLKAVKYLQYCGEGICLNVGSTCGASVIDVINIAQRVTGQKIKINELTRRIGDPPILIASSEKVKKVLGWVPQYSDIEAIITHAWYWHEHRKY